MVNTISGFLDSSDLGWTLSHEHLVSGMGGMDKISQLYDPDEALRRSQEALEAAYASGIRTIIDCTPLDLGRQADIFERLADTSPINVIAATGVYRWVPLTYYSWSPDAIAEYFIKDIEIGLESTSVKAGIIKLAWDYEYRLDDGPGSPRLQLEKAARGAARASRATGVPITCHTRASDELGLPLLDIFEDEGLDLRAITIGHSSDSRDMSYINQLLMRGTTVGLDRFQANLSDDEKRRRSQIAFDLIQSGFGDQICLGHDSASYSLNLGPSSGGGRTEDRNCWSPVPDWQIPWLIEQGVSNSDIDDIMSKSIEKTFDAASKMST